jgi:hypothetical protein
MTSLAEQPEYEPKKVGCAATVFPYIFMIFGLLIFYFGTMGVIKAGESNNWPTAAGKVITSNVKSGNKTNSTSYSAYVKYEYKVNDIIYTGYRVSYADYISVSKSHAQGIVDNYRTGSSVKVYYSSSNPNLCILEPGMKLQTFFLPASGLAIFMLGFFGFISNRNANRRAMEH